MTVVQIISWAIALGIPTGAVGFLWGKVQTLRKENKAVKTACRPF